MVQQTMEMPCSADLYNGLQVQVNRRYTKGFQYGVVYTWAKTLETVTKDGPADDGDAVFGRPLQRITGPGESTVHEGFPIWRRVHMGEDIRDRDQRWSSRRWRCRVRPTL